MSRCPSALVSLTVAVAAASSLLDGSGHAQTALPLEPGARSGQSVTPAFEGWYPNPDGSFDLLVGYYNRNQTQVLDIPIGPNNQIEPGGPDQGQPTHFLDHRQWGVFTVNVPKDFGNKKLTWTIVANGQAMSVPLGVIKDYKVEPLEDAAMGNTPPVLRFQPGGPTHTGPPRGITTSLSTTLPEPLVLTVWATDKPAKRAGPPPPGPHAPDLAIVWSMFRGPGQVTFANAKPDINKADGKTTTTATFSAPGEYVLRVQANDSSGDGGTGFQCCWTNALIKVTVRPGPSGQ
jgi:hypothetical protein